MTTYWLIGKDQSLSVGEQI